MRNEFFFHLEQKLSNSLVWLNYKSVIDVVNCPIVLKGLASRTELAESTWNMFTVPILEPVAIKLPFGETAMVVVWYAPSSSVLLKQRRVDKSHW